jgi:hypothetical protein
MKKNTLLRSAFLVLGSSLLMTACKKDHDHDHNEEEVITTVRLTLTPNGGGNAVTFQYDDPDGPGGNNPTIEPIVLPANRTYNVSVQLLNKTVNPAEDVTLEVAAESGSHRFYYESSPAALITVSNLNLDNGGIPLGITSTWTTGAAATGTMKVTLRHYGGNPPNKEANDPVNSTKSDTDVEVTFPVTIQ